MRPCTILASRIALASCFKAFICLLRVSVFVTGVSRDYNLCLGDDDNDDHDQHENEHDEYDDASYADVIGPACLC